MDPTQGRYQICVARSAADKSEENQSENPINSNMKYPETNSLNYIAMEEWDTVLEEVEEVMLEEEKKGDTVNKVRILHIF